MRRYAIVVAASIASHATALGAGFVWLDHAHLEDGAALVPRGHVLEAFTRGFAGTGYYRPLTSLSLSLDAALGGATLSHATSLAWHAAASVTTLLAASALGLSRRAALLAALLFAVHPLSALVANAIAFRSEAMVAVALLTLIWAHLRGRALVAAAAVLGGALTKETALVLAPLFVCALEVHRRSAPRDPPPDRRRLLRFEASALAVAVALRIAYAPAWRAAHPPLAVDEAIGTRLAAVAKSTAAVLLPIDRSICDAFPVTHAWQPAALAGLVVVIALSLLAWRERGAGLLLALAALPVLQLVPVTRWWSPHYLYLPLAFAAMLAARFAERLRDRTTVVVSALAAALGLVTARDGLRYADDTSLWSGEVAKQPACREGQLYLGDVERGARRWEAAARRYEAALAPRPRMLAYVDRGAALQNLGTVRFEQARFAEARRAYVAALEGTTDPRRRRELEHDLAGAALADGDPEEALRLLGAELARGDALPESQKLAAMALRKLGRVDEARALDERVRASGRW